MVLFHSMHIGNSSVIEVCPIEELSMCASLYENASNALSNFPDACYKIWLGWQWVPAIDSTCCWDHILRVSLSFFFRWYVSWMYDSQKASFRCFHDLYWMVYAIQIFVFLIKRVPKKRLQHFQRFLSRDTFAKFLQGKNQQTNFSRRKQTAAKTHTIDIWTFKFTRNGPVRVKFVKMVYKFTVRDKSIVK